jgi:hypothetical protein
MSPPPLTRFILHIFLLKKERREKSLKSRENSAVIMINIQLLKACKSSSTTSRALLNITQKVDVKIRSHVDMKRVEKRFGRDGNVVEDRLRQNCFDFPIIQSNGILSNLRQ